MIAAAPDFYGGSAREEDSADALSDPWTVSRWDLSAMTRVGTAMTESGNGPSGETESRSGKREAFSAHENAQRVIIRVARARARTYARTHAYDVHATPRMHARTHRHTHTNAHTRTDIHREDTLAATERHVSRHVEWRDVVDGREVIGNDVGIAAMERSDDKTMRDRPWR